MSQLALITQSAKDITARTTWGSAYTADGNRAVRLLVNLAGLSNAAATINVDVVITRGGNAIAELDRQSITKRANADTRVQLSLGPIELAVNDSVQVHVSSSAVGDTSVSGSVSVRDVYGSGWTSSSVWGAQIDIWGEDTMGEALGVKLAALMAQLAETENRLIVHNGFTTGAGSANTITLSSSTGPSTTSSYANRLVFVRSGTMGTATGQVRRIIAHNLATRTLTVNRPWDVIPNSGSNVIILAGAEQGAASVVAPFAVTIGNASATAYTSGGPEVPMRFWKGESPTIAITVRNADGEPVDLSGMQLAFITHNEGSDTSIDNIATPSITISGSDNEIANVPMENFTGSAKSCRYVFRATDGDKTVKLSGTFDVDEAPASV